MTDFYNKDLDAGYEDGTGYGLITDMYNFPVSICTSSGMGAGIGCGYGNEDCKGLGNGHAGCCDTISDGTGYGDFSFYVL